MPELDPTEYADTSVQAHFTLDGAVIHYRNIVVSDRQRIFAKAEEHREVYRSLGFDAEFTVDTDAADLSVQWRGNKARTSGELEVFKGMIMATVVMTSWGGSG